MSSRPPHVAESERRLHGNLGPVDGSTDTSGFEHDGGSHDDGRTSSWLFVLGLGRLGGPGGDVTLLRPSMRA